MITVVTSVARNGDEMPSCQRTVAHCGCTCWVSPSTAALILATDVTLTCLPHVNQFESDGDAWPPYTRQILNETVGKPMADRLVTLILNRLKEGLPT